MKSEQTVRINLFIPREQKQKLDLLTERTGAPLTWLVSQAIAQYLESRKKELNK